MSHCVFSLTIITFIMSHCVFSLKLLLPSLCLGNQRNPAAALPAYVEPGRGTWGSSLCDIMYKTLSVISCIRLCLSLSSQFCIICAIIKSVPFLASFFVSIHLQIDNIDPSEFPRSHVIDIPERVLLVGEATSIDIEQHVVVEHDSTSRHLSSRGQLHPGQVSTLWWQTRWAASSPQDSWILSLSTWPKMVHNIQMFKGDFF